MEIIPHLIEQGRVTPWINLLLEEQAKPSTLIDLIHVGLRSEAHNEERLHTEVLAKPDLYE